jgi:tRNA threonylcarbamoyladenosine biosynthesis protein TsaB
MSSLILAIDTTTEQGSIALARNAQLLETVALAAPEGYSAILFTAISRLLERHSVTLEEIDLFATASGPGTFTGVRVGLACTKAFGEALGKPVVAISNLQAVASFGTEPLRAVWLDARREEIYAALYDSLGACLIPEQVCRMAEFRSLVPEQGVEWLTQTGPLAGAIARIAAQKLAARKTENALTIDANYVRRTDAELKLGPRAMAK